MYSDPAKIRSHIVKLRFSEDEHRLIEAITHYTGEQKAALLRDLVLSQAAAVLTGDSSRARLADEGAFGVRLSA